MKRSRIKLNAHTFITVGLILMTLVWYGPLMLTLLKPKLIHSGFGQSNALTVKADSDAQNLGENNGILDYAKLGITTHIQASTALNPIDVQDWNKIRAILKQGAILIGSPEELKNAPLMFVIGHSSDIDPLNQYAYVFAGLGQSKKDDAFTLHFDGITTHYRVVETKVLRPSDLKSFAALEPTDANVHRVVLVTCTPLWTSLNRRVVVGELIP